MLDYELQEDILSNSLHIEVDKRLEKSLVKKGESMNGLALSLLCPVIPTFEDYEYVYSESIVELTNLEYNKCINDRQVAVLAAYECIKEFISKEDFNNLKVSSLFNRRVKNISSDEKTLKFVSSLFVSLMSFLERFSSEWNNYNAVIIDDFTFRTYGINPRSSYYSLMDMVSMDNDGVSTLHVIVPSIRDKNNPLSKFYNIRILHFVKHLQEIKINIDKIHEIRLPFYFGESITEETYNLGAAHYNASNKVFDTNLIRRPNPSMCSSCKMFDRCNPYNLFGSFVK